MPPNRPQITYDPSPSVFSGNEPISSAEELQPIPTAARRFTSVSKYQGTTDQPPQHYWQGSESRIPVRVDSRTVYNTAEIENLVVHQDFRCKLFDLSDPAMLAEYINIMDKVMNGWFLLWKCLERSAPTDLYPKFWVEWLERWQAPRR